MTGRRCWRLLAVLSLLLVSPEFLHGQSADADRVPVVAPNLRMWRDSLSEEPIPLVPNFSRPMLPVASGTTAFQKIAGAAGIIFSGRVTSVGGVSPASGQAAACTAITFHVDQGLRGILPGKTLTIHEWAGLWNNGERYRVGERVFLFLYPPGKLGLTSPVAGAMGRFAVDSQGGIRMNGRQVAILGDNPILGKRTVIPFTDFARAVQQFSWKK